ncbi:hypothetical protein CVT24_000756 [Panaeolus cyanescens]|uniref:Rho-GAP domain-containing protein n=1 Tax=Panaeolus cyanescens TaxID=181874 RepID=A0A409YCR6_9AGAR|nr:hypothetical protein CVT24_000756 [Panaeolus cyanescens]
MHNHSPSPIAHHPHHHQHLQQLNSNPPPKPSLRTWFNHFAFSRRIEKASANPPPNRYIPPSQDNSDHPVFGKPLSESLKYASVQISTANSNGELFVWGIIPVVVAKCGLYLKENATEVPGTFRVSGSSKRMRELQAIFELPPRYGKSLDWKEQKFTTHDVASVFRRYLTQMPEPVIPFNMYHQIYSSEIQWVGLFVFVFSDICPDLSSAKEPFNQEEVIKTYQSLIRRLPRANQYLLLYVLDLLSVFAGKSDKNLMTATNLAVIFRPGIISHPQHEMLPPEHGLSQRVLEFLIAQQDWFMLEMAPPPGQRSTPGSADGSTDGGSGFKDGHHGGGRPGPSDMPPPARFGGKMHEGSSSPTRRGTEGSLSDLPGHAQLGAAPNTSLAALPPSSFRGAGNMTDRSNLSTRPAAGSQLVSNHRLSGSVGSTATASQVHSPVTKHSNAISSGSSPYTHTSSSPYSTSNNQSGATTRRSPAAPSPRASPRTSPVVQHHVPQFARPTTPQLNSNQSVPTPTGTPIANAFATTVGNSITVKPAHTTPYRPVFAPPIGSGMSDVDETMVIPDDLDDLAPHSASGWGSFGRRQGGSGFLSAGEKEKGRNREKSDKEKEKERIKAMRRRTMEHRTDLGSPTAPALDSPTHSLGGRTTTESSHGQTSTASGSIKRSRTLPSRRKGADEGTASAGWTLGFGHRHRGRAKDDKEDKENMRSTEKDAKEKDKERRVLKKQRRGSSASTPTPPQAAIGQQIQGGSSPNLVREREAPDQGQPLVKWGHTPKHSPLGGGWIYTEPDSVKPS